MLRLVCSCRLELAPPTVFLLMASALSVFVTTDWRWWLYSWDITNLRKSRRLILPRIVTLCFPSIHIPTRPALWSEKTAKSHFLQYLTSNSYILPTLKTNHCIFVFIWIKQNDISIYKGLAVKFDISFSSLKLLCFPLCYSTWYYYVTSCCSWQLLIEWNFRCVLVSNLCMTSLVFPR